MSNLIVRPDTGVSGEHPLLSVTPVSAGWSYVGFDVHRLNPGERIERDTEEREYCLVILEGKVNVSTAESTWEAIGERMSVFERIPPHAVYVPGGNRYQVEALTETELAICHAPDRNGGHPARWIGPEDIRVEVRGEGATRRDIHHILPEQQSADSLLVVEVFTPPGHWSSYPPHKHDQDALPDESLLEETYYYRVNPPQGFAVQRVYTDDGSLDSTLAVKNGETVLVPKGYHPVSAPPGYEVYYLNVMAGPVRVWRIHNDPDHAWTLDPLRTREDRQE
ncbi:5-deoxy-glucuronate isomerase [Paenibacillus sp. J53TS2]|jgi:5-deoxy-glucuronate isomerase|uniref:5-deoxy-glucuronate isomerase n=1 Tax=Paenibacillus sp. J53TS2 TaxID=2807197 RepID=UPI001B16BF5C|nr:5-deoxy-glucuronate isomerase [Paenibacillus sp. J53TS2]GIP49863.1 5-deoxy-glucuronate isomerase [Paenibacillus sp. J53TS2]